MFANREILRFNSDYLTCYGWLPAVPRCSEYSLLLLLLRRCLNVVASHLGVGLERLLRILQDKAEIGPFFSGFGICLGGRLQGAELEIEAFIGFNKLFQALLEILAIVFAERSALILIEIVIDFIQQGGEVFQQIVDLLAAVFGQLGIDPYLVNGHQARFSELDEQLEPLIGLHGHFAELIGLSFSQGIAFAGGSSQAQEQKQQQYFCRGFHFCSFLGGANMASSTSSPNCSSFFSAASTGGRSSAASVLRIFSSARRQRRKWISVSFIFFLFLMARSRARVAYCRISWTVACPLTDSPSVNCLSATLTSRSATWAQSLA